MSEPKRVNFSAVIVHHIGGEKEAMLRMYFENDGMFVSYEDYVRLKAEVERLTALNQKIMIAADVIDANNQRLTKAGDAMAEAMWYGDNERSIWVKKFAETDWNRAKEGKHS